MRYIDISHLSLPEGWEDKADKLQQEIANMAPDDRQKVVSARSDLWRQLKDHLGRLSFEKCWYCETLQERSDKAVDHFRPKGRVAECPGHRGYWWLAFRCSNLRFSCTFCNSRRKDKERESTGGKHDHFPLADEHTRAHAPEDDIDLEDYCLLDPTVPLDPGLLWFNQDGRVEARHPHRRRRNARAKRSVDLYSLNHSGLQTSRKRLYQEISNLVNTYNRCFDEYDNGNTAARFSLEEISRQLMEMISPQAEWSAAAKDYLAGLRDKDHDWIDSLLSTR